MAIQIRTIDLPIDGGLSQKTEALWLQQGASLTATNLVKQKTGSLTKRIGFKNLTQNGTSPGKSDGTAGTAVTLSTGKRLAAFRGTLLQVGNDAWTDAVFSYDDTSSQWVMQDRTPEAYLLPYEQLTGSNAAITSMDLTSVGGYDVFAWVDYDSPAGCKIVTFVRNAVTGEVVQPPSILSTNNSALNSADFPKLHTNGTIAILTFLTPGGDSNIYAATMTPGPGAAWSAPTRINVTNHDVRSIGGLGIGRYDACAVIGDTTQMLLLYETSTPHIVLAKIAIPALTLTASTNVDTNDATWTADIGVPGTADLVGIAVRGDANSNEVGMAYGWLSVPGSAVRVSAGIRLYTTLANLSSQANLAAGSGVAAVGAAPGTVTLERISSQTYRVRASPQLFANPQSAIISSWTAFNSAGTMAQVGSERRTYGVQLWSRDFTQNSISYLIGWIPSTTQGTFYLFADDAWNDPTSGTTGPYGNAYFPLRLVGNIAPRLSNNVIGMSPYCHPPRIVMSNGLAKTIVSTSQTFQNSVPTLVAVDFIGTLNHAPDELGQNALLASACPSAFDGSQVFELAFPYYPIVLAPAFAGGGGLSAASYSWIVTYEWTDARGQLHRSARSVPVGGTATLNQQATLTIGVMGFSSKVKATDASQTGVGPQGWWAARRQVTIRVWRTQGNGTIYNFVGQVPNTTGAPTVTFVDTLTDAAIQGNPLLYGDGSNGTDPGSILDNLCPPGFQHGHVHKNRYLGIDGPRVWVSKAYTTGEGAGFNEATAFSVDDGPGNLTALATLDDKLVLFKQDRLFYMLGDGPSDNAVINDFTPPQRIASDVGCVDWRSVVSTAEGVYFLSAAGRRLLTRDLQVVPVPVVEDIDATNPVQTSGVVHPNEGRILWTENTDDTSGPRVGVQVSRNYILDAWTTASVGTGTGMVSAAVANVPVGGTGTSALTYHMLEVSGRVWREKSAANDTFLYEDPAGFVVSTWSSPWLKSDGLQGWSHWAYVRLLLSMQDPANLTVSLFYSYSNVATDVRNYTAAQVAAFTTPQAQFVIQPTNARAESMRIQIADSAGGSPSTGQGFRLFGVRVDYGVEPGGYRAPVAQQA